MKRMIAKYPGTCGDCRERFLKGALIDFDKHAPKGLRTFHADCNEPAYGHAEAAADSDELDAMEAAGGRDGDGFVYVKGDNRPFARTRYGLRAGYEHTGRRCEDAPCCGCC